jgi:hypothetical protein
VVEVGKVEKWEKGGGRGKWGEGSGEREVEITYQ